MRRNSVLVLVVVALFLAGWLAVRSRTTASVQTATPDRAGRIGDRSNGKDLDAALSVSDPRAPIESGTKSGGADSIPTGQTAPDVSLLIVSVVSKADGKPLASVRVSAHLASVEDYRFDEIAGTHGDLGHAPISDEHGRVEIEVPPGEMLEVEASSRIESCGSSTTEVHALGAHERREIELRVPCGDDLRFFGRLLDRETKLPVSGASVRMMRSNGFTTDDLEHVVLKVRAALEVRSDAGGRFDLALPSWASPYLRIEADGYGPIHALLQVGHEDEHHAQDLLLSRAGSLRASVLDAAGKPLANTSVHLRARGNELQTGGEIDEPGTWINYPDEQWHATLDARGSCVIDGLPAHVPLALEIHQEKKLLRREADPLEFEPGQVLERTWTIGGGARIEGRIIDQLNAPVAKHEVWLVKKTWEGEGYMAAYQGATTTAKGTSDEQGRFVLEDVPIGSWWIGAAPNADVFAAPTASDVASRTQTLEVASSAAQSITLVVSRGLFVRGHVLSPDDKPVSGAFVTCTQDGNWYPGQTSTDDKGAFAVGPLAKGTCVLWANGSGDFADSEQVTAEPGQSDVVLPLRAAGKISGQVVDASTGKPCGATVHVSANHAGDSPDANELETETREDGRFEIESLLPDRYQISFMTTDGRFASLSGIVVTAGQITDGLLVKVLPGARITVRYEGKSPNATFKIMNGSVPLSMTRGVVSGSSESVSVPSGRITIEYRPGAVGDRHTLTVDISVGETREVVLRDDG